MPTKHDPAETFFHLRILDSEKNAIRFGPFTLANAAKYTGIVETDVTFVALTEKLCADIAEYGVKYVLAQLEIDFGYEVFVTADDGQSATVYRRMDV